MSNRNRARYWKYRFKHIGTVKQVKQVRYRGFKIIVEKDETDLLSYSGIIVPISQTAKAICKQNRRIRIKSISDYTGWTSATQTIKDKKHIVDRMYRCQNYRYIYPLIEYDENFSI